MLHVVVNVVTTTPKPKNSFLKPFLSTAISSSPATCTVMKSENP